MSALLSPAERQALKARAHALRPVVMVGAEGLTDAIVRELEAALRAHELVKVRVLAGDRDERETMLGAMCEASGASPVQHIGKILVLYRQRAEADFAPQPAPPRRTTRAAKAARAADRDAPPRTSRAGTGKRAGDRERKRWSLVPEEGRPGLAPKRASKGRKPLRRIGPAKKRVR
jgi:putative YhbY family RNA-binding protein